MSAKPSRTETDRAAREVNVDEVIPPEGDKQQLDFSGLIAKVLDDLIPLPGSKWKFGVDPLIGLLPGVGDLMSTSGASVILITAASQGVPKIVLTRMCINVVINAAIGAIPGVGDAFSFWFKSNARNYRLLLKHKRGSHTSTKSDWLFVGFLLAIMVLVVVGSLALYAFWIVFLLSLISGK